MTDHRDQQPTASEPRVAKGAWLVWGLRALGAALAAGLGVALVLGSGSDRPARYDVPKRSDAEVDALLAQACRQAQAQDRPLLLEFSADWCPDSRRVFQMRATGQVAQELDRHWELAAIHVGRFDRHADLRQAFSVTSVATWVALRPNDCSASAASWPRLGQIVLEPVTGDPVSEPELTAWLRRRRNPDSAR